MNTRKFLTVVGLAILATGCNRYSYPPQSKVTASAANQNLIASLSAPKADGTAHLAVQEMTCQGSDYAIKVHYEQGFEDVLFLDLQYEVQPKSSNGTHTFTQPTGIMEIKPIDASGDVTLTVPGTQVTGKDSDVLLRLKLKTRLVVEYTSVQEQVHISDICQ